MTRTTRIAFFLGAITSFAIASYGCGGASKGGLPAEEVDAADGTGSPGGGSGGSTGSTAGTGGSAMMMTPGGGGRPGPGNMGGMMGPGTRPDGGFVFPQPPRGTDGGIPRPNNACMAGSMCMAGQTCATSCNNGRGTQSCTCFQDRYACGACDVPDGGNGNNPFQMTACPAGNPNGVACVGANNNCTTIPDSGRPVFCRCDNGSWNCPFLPQPACAADVMDRGACMTRGARCELAAAPSDAGRQGRVRECQCDNRNNMTVWNCQ
jgi:hypothetical protein